MEGQADGEILPKKKSHEDFHNLFYFDYDNNSLLSHQIMSLSPKSSPTQIDFSLTSTVSTLISQFYVSSIESQRKKKVVKSATSNVLKEE